MEMSTLYIATQGAVLRSNGGRFVVSKAETELQSIPQVALDAVVLLGYVQVTTQAAHAIMERGVPLLYLTRTGKFCGMLQPGYPKNIFRRMAQYEVSQEKAFCLDIARQLVRAKIATEADTLRAWNRSGWLDAFCATDWQDAGAASLAAESNETLLGIEAAAAAMYFDALGSAVPPPFWWDGRNRYPPRDPVNALLSLTYMLAVGEAVNVCYIAGLDPFVGYVHALDYGRPSLALDLIEPLRAPVCDQLVMRALQREEFTPDDFELQSESGCRLQPDALRRFLMLWDGPESTRPPRLVARQRLQQLCKTLNESIRLRELPDFLNADHEEALS